MNVVDRFRAWCVTDRRFENLTPDQALAVLDALLAIVMADERVTDEEWRCLRGEIARMPWAWVQGQERLEERIEDARLRVERLAPEIADGRFQAAVAARLPDGELRGVVYAMLVAVAVADGLDDRERAELARFRDAFGLRNV